MSDHAYSFYCNDKYWQRCDEENLEVVKVLEERFYDDGDLAHKITIHRCRVCGGFYKQQYRAIYNSSHLFDTEEGWDITNDYFRIEEPRWKTMGSTLDVPLPIHEAREFGYTGEDHSLKNGRCNFPVQNVELTCRAADLQFVADVTPGAWEHLKEKLYKCKRCGEWYFFKILPPYTEALLKPSNELFPLDTARLYGYATGKEFNSVNDESKATDEPVGAQNSPYFSAGASPRKQTRKTLRVTVQEALVLAPNVVRETPYKVHFFCRVPAEWLENEQLKTEFWHKIGDQVFGEDWRAETFPGAHYIIKSSETRIFDDEQVKNRNWRDIVNADDLYYFFIGSENGEAGKVTAEEFQENTDAHFQNVKESGAPSESLNLRMDEPENLNELDASLVQIWNEPEKLPAIGEWLQQNRSETAQAQYAYIILKKHLARENLELRKDKLPASWWSVGWALYLNTDALVREAKRTEMLKSMFAELVDFCEAVSGEYFAFRLKELLEKLIDGRSSRDKIMPLLPAKALNQFAEIDRMRDEEHEADIERLNQMGY
jgi:hypothetical protein